MAKLEEKNPWHKDYGVLKNTIYILKKEKQYCSSAVWFKLMLQDNYSLLMVLHLLWLNLSLLLLLKRSVIVHMCLL